MIHFNSRYCRNLNEIRWRHILSWRRLSSSGFFVYWFFRDCVGLIFDEEVFKVVVSGVFDVEVIIKPSIVITATPSILIVVILFVCFSVN